MPHADPAPSIGPPPKWLSWVAWGAGAAGLFGLLLGRVTLDAFDAEFPRRHEVRARAHSVAEIPISVDEEGEDSAEVRDALSSLPDAMAVLPQKHGSRLFLTTRAVIAERGVAADGVDGVSHVEGYFSLRDHDMYVAHDASRPGLVALHEFGHFVDDALANCSDSAAFHEIFEAAVERRNLGQHSLSAPAELFAYLFAHYFFSDRRRARLEADDPAGARFIAVLSSTGACPGLEPVGREPLR